MTNLNTTGAESSVKTQSNVPSRFPMLRRFRAQKLAVVALIFLLLMVFVAIFAPWLAPYSPSKTALEAVLQGPSGNYWLGTDDLGRDMLSRIIYGTRTSLVAAAQATALAIVIGAPFGMIAGYLGGKWDAVMSRIADALMTFPALLLAVIIVGILGPGLTNAMIAIGVVYSPRLFRISRATVIGIMPETYIKAAQTIGCRPSRTILRHLAPNALSPIVVQISLTMGTAILAEASLSFLGLGVQLPEASWGSLLGRAVPFMTTQPVAVIATGTIIALTVLSFNLLGDGIRDSIGKERRN